MAGFCKLVAQNWHKNSALVRACSGFTWIVSDCEELVRGLVTRNNGVKIIVGIAAYSIADCIS